MNSEICLIRKILVYTFIFNMSLKLLIFSFYRYKKITHFFNFIFFLFYFYLSKELFFIPSSNRNILVFMNLK